MSKSIPDSARAAEEAAAAGARPTQGGAMTHPIPSARPSGRRTAVWLLAAVLLGAAGCAQIQPRGQAAEDPEAKFDLKEVLTVGDVTDVANAAPLQVSGVGLVTGLDGTGGAAPPSEFRTLPEPQF